MKIVVSIKQVPATGADKRYTDDLRLDRAERRGHHQPARRVRHRAGPAPARRRRRRLGHLPVDGPRARPAEALRRALAMGGDDAVLVTDPALAGADEWATARVLAAALDKLAPDVALMGMASDDARGSLVPGAVAAMRDVPLLSYGAELRSPMARPASGG